MADGIQVFMQPGTVFFGGEQFSWPTATLESAAMDPSIVVAAASIAEEYNSDCLLVIRHGQLVHEQYWNGTTANDFQQTYSGTKSVFSLLVGRVIKRGYVEHFGQRVRDFIPEMPKSQGQLTFHNVLAMMPGTLNVTAEVEGAGAKGFTHLDTALTREVVALPFARYSYNNSAYRLLHTALERASGKALEDLTAEEIFDPLFFSEGTHWVLNYATTPDKGDVFLGYQSIKMTPRDFAKSAQIIIDHGKWQGERFVDPNFADNLIKVQRPEVNPSFALFHHINGAAFFQMDGKRIPHKLLPGAPDDTFLMYGNGGQIVAGIPSKDLVVVRTGNHKESIYHKDNFIARLLREIAASVT